MKKYYSAVMMLAILIAALLLVAAFFTFSHFDKSNIDVFINSDFCNAVSQYDELDEFQEGMAAVRRGEKWGYINTTGKEVIPCKYDMHVGLFSNGLACVPSDEYPKIEFIDREGNVVLSGNYCFSTEFLGTVSMDCHLRLPNFQNGMCKVYTNFNNDNDGSEYYIDTKGNKIEDVVEQAETTESEYQQLETNGKYGLKDKKGNVIVEAKYDYIQNDFENGVALVALYSGDRKIYGYVDKNGNDTFTDKDYEDLAAYKENERQEELRRQEEARQNYLERERQREMEEVNRASNPSYGNSLDGDSQYSTNEGRTAYLEVLQLQKEVRMLIDKSAPYRNIMKLEVYGSYNYQIARMNNMEILNAAVAKQKKALKIARNQLHDETLIRELNGQLELLNKAKYSD